MLRSTWVSCTSRATWPFDRAQDRPCGRPRREVRQDAGDRERLPAGAGARRGPRYGHVRAGLGGAGPRHLRPSLRRGGGRVERVRLSMGAPRFAPQEVPVVTEMEPPIVDMPLDVEGAELAVTCLSMGNPHAVLFVDGPVEGYPLEDVGPKVEHHPSFPARVNFGAARVLGRDRMEVRVWERGVGETLACGTGSSAAMVAAHLKGLVGDSVDITQPGGPLTVEWVGRGEVYLTGPAEFVFEGEWGEEIYPA